QRRGTQDIGTLFGPIMGLWFVCIGVLGGVQIAGSPQVLQALDPSYAVGFFIHHGWRAFVALGAVVLALTGAEALYADMGHFGKKSIRIAWFALVMPSLVLNYFGQGALLLSDPEAVRNPFFLLAPAWGLLPLVLLSTVATVIASQAVISGAFSLTRQAIQLGYCPRMEVRHTSATAMGQIYIPQINWTLLVAVVILVAGFKSSSNLAAAYGIAVTGTMATTTILAYFVMRHIWGWRRAVSLPIVGVLLVVDLAFFGSNLLKIADGGWFPLAAGASAFLLMSTWKRGREALLDTLAQPSGTLERFIETIDATECRRIEGTAVFLTGSKHGVPYALVHNLRHNAVLHQRVLVLTVSTEDVPFIPVEHRVLVKDMGQGFYRVWTRYGFKEQPDLPKMLNELGGQGVAFDMEHTSFFLGRETLVPGIEPALSPWRLQLFMAMSRNAGSAAAFFRLPVDRVIELGAQVAL
ncbi:MAG TPA: KUP/HAK/KT family potassium transporter, partial [Patescibacteria group bacterium]|nr:KUP/HAK/KT family potassium transporter [Patescibacteria group bacterium]